MDGDGSTSDAHDLSVDGWWQRAEAEMRARAESLAKVLAGGERPMVMPGGYHGDLSLLVHRDMHAQHVGGWRVTRFEGEEPVGHTEHGNFEDAVRMCLDWRGRLDEAREP